MKARKCIATCVCSLIWVGIARGAGAPQRLKVRVTWGQEAPRSASHSVQFEVSGAGASIENIRGISLEADEGFRNGAWETRAGGGDVDGVEFTLASRDSRAEPLQNLDLIWSDLIAASDSDTALRLSRDAAMHPGSPRLTVRMSSEGAPGFTVTEDQLRTAKAMWIPSLDVFISTGDTPITFAEHKAQLASWQGKRILERVAHEPEATYQQYASLWEDMGDPSYINPEQRGPGHIVGLTWDSAIPKFGIDRGAGVWNDYGNPDRFRFWFDFGDLKKGIAGEWKSQRLEHGLPVITTVFERNQVRYEVEQFAYPLDGPPRERRGDIDMVLLQRLRITDLSGQERTVPVAFTHGRQIPSYGTTAIAAERDGDTVTLRENAHRRVLMTVSGPTVDFNWTGTKGNQRELRRLDGRLFVRLPANGAREFVFKLPSPAVAPEDAAKLQAIDYGAAKGATLAYWTEYIHRGARFHVPDEAVNDLFNASLWHALRLPRRHGGEGGKATIDLPYSNFAYSQTGTPWPVNQAVYVDYMLYDLRGYHGIASEELEAQYRNNQEADGHVDGIANWIVYTPGMLYAAAQSYLLSGDRAAFERLLPQSMKALDWCLRQISAAEAQNDPSRRLVNGPLNDLTGPGIWAFNQAYLYAGVEIFGRALEKLGNPRAQDCKTVSERFRASVERGFAAAAVRSTLVQLRDHTWQPYVPSELDAGGRILREWYPTDVDTGATHLIRLKAIPANGVLSDWLLNDHEDNLYYKGRGIANEPVYVQQATAYLLRDEPKAVIRAFYSYMASGFSHSVYEPVEHRWTHGQFFGPPSTDGAWFELYRNMLIHERDDGALVLGLAAPRAWLADGKKIEVERAPTYYGNLSMTIESSAAAGRISAFIQMPDRKPRELLVRLRHPDGKKLQSVTVNGRTTTSFDVEKEWIRIADPRDASYRIVASY